MNDADFDDEWAEFETNIVTTTSNVLNERELSLLKQRELEEESDHKLSNDLFLDNKVKIHTSTSTSVKKQFKKTIPKKQKLKPIINKKIKTSFNSDEDDNSELDYCCDITDKMYSNLDSKHQKSNY